MHPWAKRSMRWNVVRALRAERAVARRVEDPPPRSGAHPHASADRGRVCGAFVDALTAEKRLCEGEKSDRRPASQDLR